jgi:hypothetical protein
LAISNTAFDFGGMTALQTSNQNFTVTNTGCCQLFLNYTVDNGNLPGGSTLKLVQNGFGPNSVFALPTYITAGQTIGYTLILTLGQAAMVGQSYSFTVTITDWSP